MAMNQVQFQAGLSMAQFIQRYLRYLRDQLGSVVGVATASGKVLGITRYGAYGVAVKARGMQPDYGYAGMLRDTGSNLYLTKYRAYDPRVGRWISRDPIGEVGGENIYAYVVGNPIDYTDPFGLMELPADPSGLPKDILNKSKFRRSCCCK